MGSYLEGAPEFRLQASSIAKQPWSGHGPDEAEHQEQECQQLKPPDPAFKPDNGSLLGLKSGIGLMNEGLECIGIGFSARRPNSQKINRRDHHGGGAVLPETQLVGKNMRDDAKDCRREPGQGQPQKARAIYCLSSYGFPIRSCIKQCVCVDGNKPDQPGERARAEVESELMLSVERAQEPFGNLWRR